MTRQAMERHALTLYFCLTFLISWGGVLLVFWSLNLQMDAITLAQVLLLFIPMAAGPSLSSLALTTMLEGKRGLQTLGTRVICWRVHWRWYAAAILINPLLVTATLLGLSVLVSPVYRPNFQPPLLVMGVLAGFFEEIGWTGFATPRILQKPNPWRSIIGLGLVWGVWHMLADFLGSSTPLGPYWLPYYLVFWVGAVCAYRVLMVWVYRNTRSLLLGMLQHTFFTGGFAMLMPALSPAQQTLWGAVYAAALWALTLAILLAARSRKKGGRTAGMAAGGSV